MFKTVHIKSQAVAMGCVLALCLPCVGFAGVSSSTQEQVNQLAARTEYTSLEAEAAIESIKLVREEHVDRVTVTQKMLESLELKATAHFEEMEALLESDQGTLLAQDPNSLRYAIYLRLDEEPAVTLNQINEKQLLLSSLQRQVLVGRDRPEVGYLPKQEIRDQVTILYHWVKDRQKAFDGQISTLNRLLRWKPTKELDTSQGTTLYEKLDGRKAMWDELVAKIRAMAEDDIRPEVQQILLQVYRYVKLEEGRLKADILKAQEELSLARQRQEHELAMQDQTFLLERARKLTDADLKKREDNLDSQLRELEALRALDKALTDLKLNKLETTTARQQLIARAESKDVQLLLRPFIAKGYWQPNKYNKGVDRSGMSFELIKYKGCLEYGIPGLTHLLSLGTNSRNKERDPWTFSTKISRLKDEQFEQLKKAQKYLIDLGPTLVDLGYLSR